MGYQEPKTNWTDADSFQPEDTNRIEANIEYLVGNGGEQQLGKTDNVEHGNLEVDDLTCDSITSSGAISAPTLNTGQGANELYDMNQNVKTTNSPTFAGLYLTGSLQPDTTPSEGQTSTSDGYTTLPRGWYSVYVYARAPNEDTPGAGRSASVSVQEQINGTWRTINSDSDFNVSSTATASCSAFSLKSDGTNIRVNTATTGTGATRYYQYSKH